MKEWYELSISEVAELYRRKELSPVTLIENIFKTLEKLEPELNAFITTLKEEALEAAAKAEGIFLRNEPAHMLCGIPFTVKDLFDTNGIKTTCGSKILKEHIPESTAPLVEELQNYGAILIGKTNMLEFAYGIVHPEYGQTNNPWDLTKTAGGSSGGSAAAVAKGLGLFSLGSDTGGSIRIPASYCGIAGLKPTYGLLSLRGVFPLSPTLDHAGPLAKNASDLLIIMDALVPEQQTRSTNSHENLTVGILPNKVFKEVDVNVFQVYEKTLKHLQDLGWKTKEIELKHFYRTEEIVMNIILPEAALIHKKWLSRKDEYAPLTFKQIEAGLEHRSIDYLQAKQDSVNAVNEIDQLLGEVDLLLMPTVPYPAPEEDPALEVDNEMMFTGLFNITGHPAVSIQAGYSKEYLPIGIQLVGKRLEDKRLLERAVTLEKQLVKTKKGNG
jgi:aspartyl-tRNA(Asn)/glutamyl-tRNA(Gln) amidotransferase subunit A